MWKRYAILLFAVIAMSGCAATDGSDQNDSVEIRENRSDIPESANEQINIVEIDPKQVAADVIELLKEQDLARLAAYVHPTEGVRFSPYGYVDMENDIVMQREQLQDAFQDTAPIEWGSYDGTGDAIVLSFAEYFKKFIYDRDYSNADQIGYNKTAGHGNTINNASEAYPGGFVAEYYFKGTDQHNFMDWSSLRIVLLEYEGDWMLSGIIHDQWTI